MHRIQLGNKFVYYQVFYKQNKNMYLRIKGDHLEVTCSPKITLARIEQFILEHESKILKQLARSKTSLYNEEELLLFGKKYPLKTRFNQKKAIRINNTAIEIDFSGEEFDNGYIEHFYKQQTLERIRLMMADLEEKIGHRIDLEGITFKSQLMKSRFGSCIPKKRIIKLNSILSRFDPKYLEAVLIHELIHLQIFGHQQDFYQYIDEFIPDYRKLMNELKELTYQYEV